MTRLPARQRRLGLGKLDRGDYPVRSRNGALVRGAERWRALSPQGRTITLEHGYFRLRQPGQKSLVIPVLNEEAVIPELLRRIRAVLDRVPGGPHEVVIVDDGSDDRSAGLVEAAGREDPRLVLVSLSRAFGHQRAITAGLDHAGGDAVIVMDGDLQDQPEAIPRFLVEHARGYDVVYAKRVRRKEGLLLRAPTSSSTA